MNESVPNKIENGIEKGRDVSLEISFLRHGDKDMDGNLSNAGYSDAKNLGRKWLIPRDGIKLFSSPFERTTRTLGGIIDGIQEQEARNRIFTPRTRNNLSIPESVHFDITKKKIEEIRARNGGNDEIFSLLLSEPNAQKGLEKSSSALAHMVHLYRKIGRRLQSGSKIAFQHVTHDAVIADFLRRVVIFKDEKGKRIEDIDFNNFGGPIKYLEGFSIDLNYDEKGHEHLKIIFRGEKFDVDETKLNELEIFFRKHH
jgi:hypothetical protein